MCVMDTRFELQYKAVAVKRSFFLVCKQLPIVSIVYLNGSWVDGSLSQRGQT